LWNEGVFLVTIFLAFIACNYEQDNANNSPTLAIDTITPNHHIETPAEKGYTIFKTSCAMCHSLGPEKILGPGLQGITTRVPQPYDSWLKKYIRNNAQVLKSGDNYAKKIFVANDNIVMPNYDSVLSDSQINDIIALLVNPPKQESVVP
jgi:cytochrome c2